MIINDFGENLAKHVLLPSYCVTHFYENDESSKIICEVNKNNSGECVFKY